MGRFRLMAVCLLAGGGLVSCLHTESDDGASSAVAGFMATSHPEVADIDDLTTGTRIDFIRGDGNEVAGYDSPSLYAQLYAPRDGFSLEDVQEELRERILSEGWTTISDGEFFCATPQSSGGNPAARVSITEDPVRADLAPNVRFTLDRYWAC